MGIRVLEALGGELGYSDAEQVHIEVPWQMRLVQGLLDIALAANTASRGGGRGPRRSCAALSLFVAEPDVIFNKAYYHAVFLSGCIKGAAPIPTEMSPCHLRPLACHSSPHLARRIKVQCRTP